MMVTAAVILAVLWYAFWVEPTITTLRCSAMLLSYPPQCVTAMDMWVGDLGSWGYRRSGYYGAAMFLAFAVPGVVVGVMLLLSRPVESRAYRVWRGLGLALALVLLALWLLTLDPWPWAVDVLGGIGISYVILTLLWTWPDPLERPNGSVAASLDTSTFPPSGVPSDSWRGWLRFVVFLVAGAGLVLAGLVGAVAGLVVFIDWIADLVGLPTAFYCGGPSVCKAASATAGVLGLLAASVAVVGVGAGMRLLRKTHMAEAYAAWTRGSAPKGKP